MTEVPPAPPAPRAPGALAGMPVDGLEGLLTDVDAVSYTHLRAHETVLDLVCRLLLEKKKHDTVPSERNVKTIT